jgi:hypothetical protein
MLHAMMLLCEEDQHEVDTDVPYSSSGWINHLQSNIYYDQGQNGTSKLSYQLLSTRKHIASSSLLFIICTPSFSTISPTAS